MAFLLATGTLAAQTRPIDWQAVASLQGRWVRLTLSDGLWRSARAA